MEYLQRLSSRKFLLTIAGVILVSLKPDQADSIVTLIGLFIGAEGAKDLADSVRNSK